MEPIYFVFALKRTRENKQNMACLTKSHFMCSFCVCCDKTKMAYSRDHVSGCMFMTSYKMCWLADPEWENKNFYGLRLAWLHHSCLKVACGSFFLLLFQTDNWGTNSRNTEVTGLRWILKCIHEHTQKVGTEMCWSGDFQLNMLKRIVLIIPVIKYIYYSYQLPWKNQGCLQMTASRLLLPSLFFLAGKPTSAKSLQWGSEGLINSMEVGNT